MSVILPVVPLKVNIVLKKDPLNKVVHLEDTEDNTESVVEEVETVGEGQRYFCYILKNKVQPQKTYNGFTVDLGRRIRQHNSEIVGGAKYTTSCGNRTWHYYAVLTGFKTSVSALSCEWWIKHPTGHRKRPIKYCGPRGRILGLQLVLENPRFKGYDPKLEYTLWIARTHLSCLNTSKFHSKIKVMTFEKKEDITNYYEQVDTVKPVVPVAVDVKDIVKEKIQVKIVRKDELKILEDSKCNVKQ